METTVMATASGQAASGQTALNPAASYRSTGKLFPKRLEQWVSACMRCTEALSEKASAFWGLPVKLKLLAVSPKNLYFWRNDDFYVAQMSLLSAGNALSDLSAQLRLSEDACQELIEAAFGPAGNGQPFVLKNITELEAAALNAFSKQLFEGLSKRLIQTKIAPQTTANQHTLLSQKRVHLVWGLKVNTMASGLAQSVGKLVLTVPFQAIRTDWLALSQEDPLPVADTFFFHARLPVHLGLGKTSVSLAELRQLEAGDIVVLSDSQANRAWLRLEDSQLAAHGSNNDLIFPFSINPHTLLHRHVPYTPDLTSLELSKELSMSSSSSFSSSTSLSSEALWDNLMIDVTAEFEPVSMPLGQIKEICEGLIVEVGDLIQNQVQLHVDGKVLAIGDLVIVGDKFGVRVTHVAAEREASSAQQLTTTEVSLPDEQNSPSKDRSSVTHLETDAASNQDNDDSFDDLDDFLLDDDEDNDNENE